VDEALIGGLAGIAGAVLGAVLGGTGKYWLLRRDAWMEARRSGLLLLADVRALCGAEPGSRVVTGTELGLKSWEAHREVLAGFRRGRFPNGFRASEWLELARHFAQLKELHTACPTDGDGDRWSKAQAELVAAERLLVRFELDPRVLPYVIWGTLRR
jgi:hypothetical protein